MSEERRKMNKQSTGTVPKSKYRNNVDSSLSGQDSCSTNNLASYLHHLSESSNFIRNPRRDERSSCTIMDTDLEDSFTVQQLQNSGITISQANNDILTSNINTSTSTRINPYESTLIYENSTKYLNKKQIEDKLHEIREYLKITNSLMTNMRNDDDQAADQAEHESLEKMVNDLKDSEKKLVDILDQMKSDENVDATNEQLIQNGVDTSEHNASLFKRNELDVNLDNPNEEYDILRDQQWTLMQLQEKSENKLRDARQIQKKFLSAHCENDVKSLSNLKDNKNCSEQDFDAAIIELEERTKRLKPPGVSTQRIHENILAKVESLHNQIVNMHSANDEREQLIDTLDNRDADLRTQHVELQNKLIELQNKKLQVDRLVTQLESLGEDGEDVGGQVRRIVTMKDQLKKLKDMLEIVKNSENIMQNTNASIDIQTVSSDSLICENVLDKDIQKSKPQPLIQTESNVLKYDNDTTSIANDSQLKDVNKKTTDQSSRGVKHRMPNITEKIALHTELEAKKKELEAIMGKHKASTSNLNHDVGIDTKSEFNCTSNIINETWIPLPSPQNQSVDADRFSSDECQHDINDYSELHDNHNSLLTTPSYSSNTSKYRFENNPRREYISSSEFDRLQNSSRTSDRNLRSSSAATTGYIREPPRLNSEQDNRTQVQKQLQLIKSVCDSMLEQQTTNLPLNVQHLRKKITPSLYSEPHRFASPNPHAMNALNIMNPSIDIPCFPVNNMYGNLNSDVNNYQSWLASNTIQTQSLMLNTLNQCCQMLWLQQRELMSLRNAVTLLEEKVENSSYGGVQHHLTPSLQNTSQDYRSMNHYRPVSTSKVNHVPAAFSLPNLNHYSTPSSNLDPNYINQNNIQQSGRLSDLSLNNVNVNHLNTLQGVEHANSGLHGVNSNINHTLPNQMWNGQALNNQVTPGNRANNYWDNFRR